MSLSDLVYRPFETLVRPLDNPYAPLPDSGPLALLMHFARKFRGVLAAMSVPASCRYRNLPPARAAA